MYGTDCCNSCPTVQSVSIPGLEGDRGETGADGTDAVIAPGALNPEGNVIGVEGQTYLNTTDDSFWIKKSGVDEYGWICLIAGAGCLLFMLFLSGMTANAQPIIRNVFTTNTTPAASLLVTNAALVSQTNNYSYMSNNIYALTTTNAGIRTSITNAALVSQTNNYSYLSNAVVSIVSTNSSVSNRLAYTTITNSAYMQGLIGQTNNYSWISNNIVSIVTTNLSVRSTVQYPSANLTNWSANPQGLSCMIFAVDDQTITNQLWFTNGVLYVTNRYSF